MKKKSELSIITEAKKLVTYILTITEKSDKKYRHTFVRKLHEISIEIVELLIYANYTEITDSKRKEYQKQAFVKLKVLDYYANTANEVNCILAKQYEFIAKSIYACENLLRGWVASDEKRKV